MSISDEAVIRAKTKNWLTQKLKESKTEIVYGPTITHGRGNLSDILTAERNVNENLNKVWLDIQELIPSLEIEPDVLTIIRKNSNIQWVVVECKARNLKVADLAQIMFYATTLQAYAAILTSVGTINENIKTLHKKQRLKYIGTGDKGEVLHKHIGIYIYDHITNEFKLRFPSLYIF